MWIELKGICLTHIRPPGLILCTVKQRKQTKKSLQGNKKLLANRDKLLQG